MLPSPFVHRAILVLGASATILFAEPTPGSIALGGAVIALGALAWILATSSDPAIEPPQRGGMHAFVRHPRLLAGFILATGLVLWAASEEPRGRWVPRTVVPLGLLYFFLGVLPRADAALRERLREGGAEGIAYLAHVPSFVPRATPWRGVPAAPLSLARSAAPGSIVWLAAAAAIAFCCLERARWSGWLGF
jgi:hypothetical protein